ncbi:uncharacterized protein LOC129719864 [Wyeomyia smithii]|uniref:uncharacterized protein LOC129719864 n=1 Tax=Wyeomyia smithii TaxID=174621 RepID=UPI002467E5EC|nr:uncharacterized protein LOC129719864 [Wyeomyia smithii]
MCVEMIDLCDGRVKMQNSLTVPKTCAVVACSFRGDRDGCRFSRFPAIDHRTKERIHLSTLRQQKWLSALKRDDLKANNLKHTVVCHRHFIGGKSANLMDMNHPDWVPNRELGYPRKIPSNAEARYRRVKLRNEQKTKRQPSEPVNSPIGEESNASLEYQVSSLQSDLTACKRQLELIKAKEMPFSATNMEEFGQRDTKAKYFTGLSNRTLQLLFEYTEPYLPDGKKSSFQVLLLTLTRIRLNLDFTLLSYMADISISHTVTLFEKCIYVLYQRLKHLITWPTRAANQNLTPSCFRKHFGDKVTVIIDCVEILTENPTGVLEAAQMWSNYKHAHTIKYLIGIASNGAIIFISNAYGGRASDKFITMNCGILEKIQKGDYILADRGFLIKDAVNSVGAELLMPAFTVGQYQLHPLDVEKTRTLANVRIHVERVIGQLRKKYKILYKNKFPQSTLEKSG